MRVAAESQVWIVPTQRGVWIPAQFVHSIECSGPVAMRTLYVRPDLAESLPDSCQVLHVSPLLRELILDIVDQGSLEDRDEVQLRLARVLVDRLQQAPKVSLEVILPKDGRARQLADRILANPSGTEPLNALAEGVGASARTLERIFRKETGCTVGRWRQQARLLHAVRLLAEGLSVNRVAMDAGYESTSAFITMFKKALGQTPGQFRELSGKPDEIP